MVTKGDACCSVVGDGNSCKNDGWLPATYVTFTTNHQPISNTHTVVEALMSKLAPFKVLEVLAVMSSMVPLKKVVLLELSTMVLVVIVGSRW